MPLLNVNKNIYIFDIEMFTIGIILHNQINIWNNEKELILNAQDCKRIFDVVYCITIHSSQAKTLTNPIQHMTGISSSLITIIVGWVVGSG